MRIVVDTNVIVSALVFGGVPRQVLDLALTGVCSLYFSKPIQAEVERILKEKFGWSREEIHARARTIWNLGTEVSPQVSLAVITNDPDDDRVLECAVAAEANAIISGDGHLLRLVSFQSIPILSPRQFFDRLVR
ncbi:MAG: putative toxin-antitoxin system toxin component, PIN family [Terriglobales bacterium]